MSESSARISPTGKGSQLGPIKSPTLFDARTKLARTVSNDPWKKSFSCFDQGEGGVVPATEQYFSAVREVCNETGALMMVDEVQVS